MKGIEEILINSAPIFAKLTDGFVAITDKDGIRIKVIDSSGNSITTLENRRLDLAAKAIQEQRVLSGPSELSKGAKIWAIPIGDYALVVTDDGKKQKQQQLQMSLEDSLGLIADVLGSEASLFNEVGQITHSVNQDGTINENVVGQINQDAYRAMSLFKSQVVKSSVVPGAKSVLIPITREVGLELSNLRVKDKDAEKRDKGYAKYTFDDIIGDSPRFQKVKEFCSRVANSSSPVLLIGESGTGKELFAHAIHNASDRAEKKFIAINCGAIPASLIESILFGYEPGTFTGGSPTGKKGLFVEANQGTLFLDEIGEMDLQLQTRLLRVLQDKEVMSLGSTKSQEVDVRVIAATNKNLKELVNEGKFREDLYYRLNVLEVEIPPLRERMDDLVALVNRFIEEFNLLFSKKITACSPEALKIMSKYHWPGNVRQLRNCIERIANLVDHGEIRQEHLPDYIFERNNPPVMEEVLSPASHQTLDDTIRSIERRLIEQTLIETRYNKQKAAEKLGISMTTLWRKMNNVGLNHGFERVE